MRSFRVFNDTANVRVVWKVFGLRLGPLGQIAMLLLTAISALLVTTGNLIVPIATFVIGLIVIATYVTVLSFLDDTGALSERTQLRLLRRGLKHRMSANFDLPGI